MFDVTMNRNQYKQLLVLNRDNIHRKRIIEIMTKEDFIFIDSSPSDEVIIQSLSSGNGSLSSSDVYGGGGGGGNGSIEQSLDKQANILANEVYGINASSFQELHHTFRKKRKNRK
jgi:hypothetical protein